MEENRENAYNCLCDVLKHPIPLKSRKDIIKVCIGTLVKYRELFLPKHFREMKGTLGISQMEALSAQKSEINEKAREKKNRNIFTDHLPAILLSYMAYSIPLIKGAKHRSHLAKLQSVCFAPYLLIRQRNMPYI